MRRILPILFAMGAAPAAGQDALTRRGADPATLEALFRGASARPVPPGVYNGAVLWVDGAKLPKARARLQSGVWKGKHFTGCDQFVNRFPGFEAIPAAGRLEASWADGMPAYVLEYAPGSPLFGPNRDELREVSPGVWLGRVWNRQTPGRGGSWFVLRRE